MADCVETNQHDLARSEPSTRMLFGDASRWIRLASQVRLRTYATDQRRGSTSYRNWHRSNPSDWSKAPDVGDVTVVEYYARGSFFSSRRTFAWPPSPCHMYYRAFNVLGRPGIVSIVPLTASSEAIDVQDRVPLGEFESPNIVFDFVRGSGKRPDNPSVRITRDKSKIGSFPPKSYASIAVTNYKKTMMRPVSPYRFLDSVDYISLKDARIDRPTEVQIFGVSGVELTWLIFPAAIYAVEITFHPERTLFGRSKPGRTLRVTIEYWEQ